MFCLPKTAWPPTSEVGKAKREPTFERADEALQQKVLEKVQGPMNELLDKPLSKNEFYTGMDALADALVAELCLVPEGASPADFYDEKDVRSAFSEAESRIVAMSFCEPRSW